MTGKKKEKLANPNIVIYLWELVEECSRMSAISPIISSSQQRPPLQPRDTPLDENGTKCSTSTDCTSTSLNSNLHNKRLSHDNFLSESENEPLKPVTNKRQRTKSGSDLMGTVDNNWSSSECFNIKNDPSPLCERNYRNITKPDVQEIPIDNSKLRVLPGDNQEKNVDLTKPILDMDCKNFQNHNNELVNGNFYGKISVDNIETVNGNNGGLSPHCAATMEYVTQLPEGCTNSVSSNNLVGDSGHTESDDELEDDDNYLDSSEPEENDLETCLLPVEEDEESCGEDDQSVISSVTVGSTCSLRSIASETMSSIYMNENGIASNEDGSLLYCSVASSAPLNALTPSLFSHVPPTVNFCKYDETTAKLPEEISKILKWRFTTITPLIVRKTIINSGYKIIKKSLMWCGTWGKHMKSPCFKGIKDYQKVNHFPGTFQIGRKDKLWKNFAKLQSKFGKEEFGFIPKTFVLPGDLSTLKAAFDKEGVKKKWIVKPPASARGTGIQVVNKWSQMPVDTPAVVQRYISRPYLINNTKFDIRLYVLVTSFHPLRIFLYEDGLVRFASVQYQKTSKTLSDRFMHLTNYSVNKSSSSYTHNDDAGHCQGHKWTLKTLWGYLKAQDVDTGALWSKIADIVIKTIIAGETDIVVRTKKYTRSMYNCFELFGFDVILDEKLRPWLLEVNISPSLHSASSLDHSVKGPLIADLLNLVGYHIPDKITQERQEELLTELNLGSKVSGLCLDRRLYTRLLTAEEQAKHVQMNNLPRSQYLTAILENLQPDDARHLTMAEDQLQRAGKFACIFPTCDTHNYFGFLSKIRYYNRLMDAWENAYGECRSKGIELLEKLCEKKIHLKVTPRFKLPKIVVDPGMSNMRIRPLVCPPQTNLSPCPSPSSVFPEEELSRRQEGETAQNPSAPPLTQVERLQEEPSARECHQERDSARKLLKGRPRLVVPLVPIRPALISRMTSSRKTKAILVDGKTLAFLQAVRNVNPKQSSSKTVQSSLNCED